jgi:molybdopterin-guanine dinucleotide biosynthesis protein A
VKPLVGIFVGGKATRFGGIAKGMLPSPERGEPIVARLARICADAAGADVVLVGRAAAYDALGLPSLEDAPGAAGPLGGLSALLTEAARRDSIAIALAGDLPYVTTAMVARVASFAPHAPAVAPRQAGLWQPLFARYEPVACVPLVEAAIAERSFRARVLLEKLGSRAVELPLDATEVALLADWDRPEDVEA